MNNKKQYLYEIANSKKIIGKQIKEIEHVQNEIPDEKPEVDTQEAPVYFREDEDEYEEK